MKRKRIGRQEIEQDFVGAARDGGLVHAEAGGGVGLRVEVHDEDALAELRQVRAEVDGSGGFAHAAFLIDEGVDASHFDFRFPIDDLRLVGGDWRLVIGDLIDELYKYKSRINACSGFCLFI